MLSLRLVSKKKREKPSLCHWPWIRILRPFMYTVPATVTNYLRRIRGQLKQLHNVLEFDLSTTTDNETSPNPNNTQPRTENELELQKTIYEHTHIAWSRRLSQFLKGNFQVVPVPANHRDISVKLSRQDVLPIIFPPGNQAKLDVQSRVYDGLLERLKVTMNDEGLAFKKGTVPQLSMDVNVHAECTLLAYHLQHPTSPYRYFGGSKLSCHGCSTFFTSYNRVAESLSLPQFFTKGCDNKVYLWWPCPFLLSPEQQIRLRDKGPNSRYLG